MLKQGGNAPGGLLVTGAAGRIGRCLRAIWGDTLPILWQSRFGGGVGGLAWDIGQNPPPVLPRGMVVLHLAGKTSGTAQELASNVSVTRAVCAAAVQAGARYVFVMSSAAVYAPGPLALGEGVLPAPVSPYGAAKLEAERVAAEVVQGSATGLTVLRLANLAGADALLGRARDMVVLDPIAGQSGGPERSYIGPRVLASVLEGLVLRVGGLPDVVNVAQQPPVAMADLLQARGAAWRFGPEREGAVPRVVLATERLAGLVEVPLATATGLVADMLSVPGWPE